MLKSFYSVVLSELWFSKYKSCNLFLQSGLFWFYERKTKKVCQWELTSATVPISRGLALIASPIFLFVFGVFLWVEVGLRSGIVTDCNSNALHLKAVYQKYICICWTLSSGQMCDRVFCAGHIALDPSVFKLFQTIIVSLFWPLNHISWYRHSV